MPNVGYMIAAVLGFGFIIFIHELGHFLAAKLFKVKVKAFSLGFPPTILHKQIGETDYRLGAILAGGYVLMLGEDQEEAEAAHDPRALGNILPWKRAVIFLAGVFLNVVSAMVIFIVASVVGIEVVPPVVGGVADPSPAKAAGLRPGDRILSIDGEQVDSFDDIPQLVFIGSVSDPEHKFVIRLEGRPEPVEMVSVVGEAKGLPALGIAGPALPVIKKLKAGCPAEQAGLKAGDRITAVDDRPVAFAAELFDLLEKLPAQPFTITVERDGKESVLQVDPATLAAPDYGLFCLTLIKKVEAGSPAEKAGLRAGDFVLEVAGGKYPIHSDITRAVQASGGKPIEFSVYRQGKVKQLSAQPEFRESLGYYQLGMVLSLGEDPPTLLAAGKPSAAADASVPDGAVITAINGKATRSWQRLLERLDELEGQPAGVTFRPSGGGEERTVTVAPRVQRPEMFLADVTFEGSLLENLKPIYNPLQALQFGVRKIKRLVLLQYATLKGLATERVPADQLMGPLRIGVGFYKTAEAGSGRFMAFLGFVSVAIALLNVMPVPPLDGGHVVFVIVEKIMGRPPPLKARQFATVAGIALILGLVVFAFYNDINWIMEKLFY